MRIFCTLFTLFFFVVHPLLSQGTVSKGQKSTGTVSGKQGARSLPVSGKQLPKNIEDVIEQEIKNHPEKRKEVDDFLHQYGFPDSKDIPLNDVKHIITEILKDNDKRSQPVDPAQAGTILINAWLKVYPDKPVPPEILNLQNETNCSSAAVILVGLRNELRKNDAENFFTPTVVGKLDNNAGERSSIESAVKIIDGYTSKCLSSPEVLDVSLRDWLSHIVGVLRFEDTGVRCIGTLISEREVLSARHCVFQKNQGEYKLIPWWDLKFTLPSDPGHEWDVDKKRDPPGIDRSSYDDSDYANDWIILVLKSPALTVPAPQFFPPHDFDPLLLFSFQPLLYYRDILAQHIGYPFSAKSWKDQIRVDQSSSCRVSLVSPGGCLTHGCQSEGGVSGAPLFRRRSNGEMPSIVGLHQGSTDTAYKGTCLTVDGSELPNRGRALSQTFLTSLGDSTAPHLTEKETN